ncbi:MAG: DUF3822 family protein, partial [Prolixibacteraceae bacterium]|nr:DUF3822 family protein [Prolixibacteraceae bacterium]
MQEFLFQDSNFKLSGNQNILSIQASLDGFSILIRGADNPSSFYLHQYPFSQTTSSGLIRKLRELLEKEHPSDKAFEKVNISFTNNR